MNAQQSNRRSSLFPAALRTGNVLLFAGAVGALGVLVSCRANSGLWPDGAGGSGGGQGTGGWQWQSTSSSGGRSASSSGTGRTGATSSTGIQPAGPTGASVGSGQATSSAASGTSGAGTGGAASSGSSTAASSGPGTTASTGSGANCQYPAGPYGIDQGSTVDPSLSWQGYKEGASQPSMLNITDYFDCDGSKHIGALLIDTSATWCGACQQEATDFGSEMAAWVAQGIHVITLIYQDDAGNPATVATAQQWWSTFGLTSSAVVADPNGTFLPQNGSVGLPMQVIVNPRTMQIVSTEQGYCGDDSMLVALAQMNK